MWNEIFKFLKFIKIQQLPSHWKTLHVDKTLNKYIIYFLIEYFHEIK